MVLADYDKTGNYSYQPRVSIYIAQKLRHISRAPYTGLSVSAN